MIPQTQTVLGTGAEGATPGNCVQAAVASLLERPLEQVPHFLLFEDWWPNAVALWFRSQQKRLRIYDDRQTYRVMWEVAGVRTAPLALAPSAQMMLAVGASVNHEGWSHIVVWKAGRLVHDPHPLGYGLVGAPVQFWQITDGAS